MMLVVAIVIIIALVALFIVTFLVYKKMPAPKGMEKVRVSEENCKGCENDSCSLRKDE